MVVDYQQGKIYCLRSHQTDDIYIGSTTQSLSMRMVGHRVYYKRWKEGKMCYISSVELLQYDDCYIELIEKCPCDCRMELERREGQLIREMDCVNKRIAGRTIQEWREDNKGALLERCKEYREKNKEALIERKRKEYHKNRERYIQYCKQYREVNKEVLAQRRNKKVTCECGCTYTRSNKARHERSKKHIKFINQ